MKRFIRTIPGKTILFLLCMISAIIFVISAASAYILTFTGYNFYTNSEEELKEKLIINPLLISTGNDLFWNYLNYDAVPDTIDAEYTILNGSGDTVAYSEKGLDPEEMDLKICFEVSRDSKGRITNFCEISSDFYAKSTGAEYYVVGVSVKESALSSDLAFYAEMLHVAYSLRYAVFIFLALSLLLGIFSFVLLMSVSGRRPDSDELHTGFFHKLPYDVLLFLLITAGCLIFLVIDEAEVHMSSRGVIVLLIPSALAGMTCFLSFCMTTAVRLKDGSLFKNTIIWRILLLLRKILRVLWKQLGRLHNYNMTILHGLPLIWKGALALLCFFLYNLVVLFITSQAGGFGLFLFLLEMVILIPVTTYACISMKKLSIGGKALAKGDLSYVTDTKGMLWDLKEHGNNLNNIAKGMSIAVEDRLKSERMKTELITNVSHDIKTPLTSIINYAMLISEEPNDNPKIDEYSEVLVRQAGKLKRLIEDLVEASKASTGNLEVTLTPCDASVFLTQADGEYEEKLPKSKLQMITKIPEQEILIMADGRRMWRVFDNLMNNICKYAQPGTRVYLSLEELQGNAVITFKNTSREALDMTEEELMERFTRGDSSRNTEGNGLGLSIARSMAELQGGTLSLSIDGDLFKAILTFPVIY